MTPADDSPRPRVLLVEPDEAFAGALAEEPGMSLVRFDRAAGGAHALRLVRGTPYDAVLTSPTSPVHEDLALLEEMRLLRPGVKVVVLARDATADDVVASLRAHAFACFVAPYDAAPVADMIRRAVRNPDWHDGIQMLSARPDWLSLRVDCRRLAADRLIHFLGELARDVPEVLRDDLLTAFREIVLNAMEHGAGFGSGEMIEVTAVRTQRAIVYYVRDPGPGFDPADLPHAALANPPDDPLAHAARRERLGLRPGGFGLLIARRVVDEFLHSERANEVLLIKHTA